MLNHFAAFCRRGALRFFRPKTSRASAGLMTLSDTALRTSAALVKLMLTLPRALRRLTTSRAAWNSAGEISVLGVIRSALRHRASASWRARLRQGPRPAVRCHRGVRRARHRSQPGPLPAATPDATLAGATSRVSDSVDDGLDL